MHEENGLLVEDTADFYVDGELIDSIAPEYPGGPVTPPTPPVKAGYRFVKWSGGYNSVGNERVICVGIYQKLPGTSVLYYNSTKNKIEYVTECRVVQKLDGECTLSFTTWIEHCSDIKVSDLVVLDNLMFDVTKVRKTDVNGLILVTVDCEHISFRLTDAVVESLTITDSITSVLNEIFSGTGLTVDVESGLDLSGYPDVEYDFSEEHTKRDLLLNITENNDLEFYYHNKSVVITEMVGNYQPANVFDSGCVISMEESCGVGDDDVSYTIELGNKMNFGLGDMVNVKNSKFHTDDRNRIVGIEWDPFEASTCKITVGKYSPTLTDVVNDVKEETKETKKKVENSTSSGSGSSGGSSGGTSGGTSGGSYSGGGWTIQSVDVLPDTGSANVLYLLRG